MHSLHFCRVSVSQRYMKRKRIKQLGLVIENKGYCKLFWLGWMCIQTKMSASKEEMSLAGSSMKIDEKKW